MTDSTPSAVPRLKRECQRLREQRDNLRRAAEDLIAAWDRFGNDESLMNPLGSDVPEMVRALRISLDDLESVR
jgi:hypothetical protein